MPRARLTRNRALLLCAGLLAAVLAAYAASLGNAPVWDDRPLVVDNPYLGSLAGLGRLWTTDLWSASGQGEPSSYYRPFTMLTFWLNVAVGGRSAASLRLGNILIHAANALLLARFARKATGIEWRPAVLVALLFAVAPVCSEPVLWISGRFDLLVVTFALLALLAARREGRVGLALTLASVGGGLLCKESFVGWLPLLLLDDVFVRRVRGRGLLVKYLGVAAIAGAYLALRAVIGIPSLTAVTNTGVRALAESFFFLVATFLRELAWPTTLDPFRPYTAISLFGLVVTVAVLACLVAAPVVIVQRERRSVKARFAVFGVAWFVLATVPSAIVGPTLAMIGDRYAYLPLVGLFLAAATAVGALEARSARAWRDVSALASMLALAWGISTGLHAREWRDDRSLAESSLASDPENPYALYWLGSDAAQHEQLDKADDLLKRSLARNPGAWRTWNAVCYLRLHQNRVVEAERACHEAIERNAQSPRAWLNLASVYVRASRWQDALASADRALALKPAYAEAHYLAGVSAANLGQYALASSHVEAGLHTEPSHPRLLTLRADLARHQSEQP
jgi:Flp pilus assembly protein TadD